MAVQAQVPTLCKGPCLLSKYTTKDRRLRWAARHVKDHHQDILVSKVRLILRNTDVVYQTFLAPWTTWAPMPRDSKCTSQTRSCRCRKTFRRTCNGLQEDRTFWTTSAAVQVLQIL